MINLQIDNISVSVPKNSTVLQACDKLGIDVPRFCFHERLLIAGNCRMCLVEIEKSPKPVASCALPVSEGMKVFTKTPLVKKAQEGVLEFLLLNHPLDCPICDQGGECDLQDQAMLFGSDSSRFYDYKRGVEDKDCGPLIKTIMTRCIHCTRCVRFSTEIAGVPELGTLGRGTNTQIGTYLDKVLTSELSGNVIDLCPVGALTSKPYAFKARSWELKSVNSIDVSDSCGSNIVINFKGNEVMRILPRLNENINEEWISDKTRFSYDGLSVQRLGVPLLISNKKFKSIKWEEAFNTMFLNIYPDLFNLDDSFNIIFGKEVDIETILTLKFFFNKLNCFNLYSESVYSKNSSDLFYKFNCRIKEIQDSDLCVLVNCNTRFESSMLNLHLRKSVLSGKLKVGYFGPLMDLTFKTNHLGLTSNSFFEFIKGKHPFSKELSKAKNPIFIINSAIFSNKELLFINSILTQILNLSTKCLNILNIEASSVGLRELGIQGINNIKPRKHLLSVGTNLNSSQIKHLYNNVGFSIYNGSHGVNETSLSNLVLPGKAFTEKKVTFTNLEGLLQNTNTSLFGLGESRDDWKIFNAFFSYLSINTSFFNLKEIFFDNLKSLNSFFLKEYPFLGRLRCYNRTLNFRINYVFFKEKNSFLLSKNRILNFYGTTIISSFSRVMKECANTIKILNFKK